MTKAHRQYMMPEGMRYASLQERRRFYSDQFKAVKAKAWLEFRPGPTVLAVIIGRHTGIHSRRFRHVRRNTILIDDYSDWSEVVREVREFLPESVYYDRNIYRSWDDARRLKWGLSALGDRYGQELAFDIDPENIECPVHGTLSEKMRRRQGLGFCLLELAVAREHAINLYDELENEFSELSIVYSGRGFHIHVLDEDTYFWSHRRRRRLARRLISKGYPLDVWVTAGSMRLIRLPYSLHGMVSRIVLPIRRKDLEQFHPVRDKKCRPRFLAGRDYASGVFCAWPS